MTMSNLYKNLVGILVLTLMWINTLFWCTPLIIMAFFKLIIPIKALRISISKLLIFFSESFISVNSWLLKHISRVNIDVSEIEGLNHEFSYVLIANHQSYADILILQQIFNYKIPFLKFFLKRQLIWVPFLGLAWWALDFPFMKRYTKKYLRKHPEKAGEDFESTKKSCEKFKDFPVTIMNFAEGTRFTHAKHQNQQSPFSHSLKPKAGGLGYVMTIMGEKIHRLIDVSIFYPKQTPGLLGFLGGKANKIQVKLRMFEIPEAIRGNYTEDKHCRVQTQQWLNDIWEEKNKWIEEQSKKI